MYVLLSTHILFAAYTKLTHFLYRHAAVSYSQIEIVKFLLEKGANVNVEDFEKDTPLYVAENVEMAQLLLDHGADPKHINEDGLSAAATALEEGWDQVAQLLAGITGEELPTEEEEETEENALAHTMREEPLEEEEDEGEMSEELSSKMQEIMKRIEEQGGVENEEELREMVTKMVLDEMQRSLDNAEE
jgi:hypothetical protein